jgi:hypothetical protein
MENKNSKSSGQKILAVVVGIIVAAFAVIMIFAAANTHGGESSGKESTAKKLEKADLVGYWYVPSENLEDGVEEYYEFTDDNTYRFYELTDGAVDMAELNGSYTFADGTAATKANVQFFEKDSSGNNTISSGHVTGILECKSWTKNTIHFLEKSEDYDGSEKLILKRMDTDEKIKEAESKRLDQIDKIDQQIDAQAGDNVY